MFFRSSPKPHKQYLWFRLLFFAKRLTAKSTILDVGCADMRNKRFFKDFSYTGLEPDSALLEKGYLSNPDATCVNTTIDNFQPRYPYDVVLCVQVFVNSDFVDADTPSAVNKLISLVAPSGSLFFNTSQHTTKYEPLFVSNLRNSFKTVRHIKYSNLGIAQTNRIVSAFLGFLMILIPPLRCYPRHLKSIFICHNKLPDS